jgi:hypothetical protein
MWRKLIFSNLASITGTSDEDLCKSILLTVRNFSGKSCGKNQNIRFMLSDFRSADRAAFEIMWQNVMQPNWPKMTMLCGAATTLLAWGITKARIGISNMQYYCISTATLVTWTRLNITQHEHFVRYTLYQHFWN